MMDHQEIDFLVQETFKHVEANEGQFNDFRITESTQTTPEKKIQKTENADLSKSNTCQEMDSFADEKTVHVIIQKNSEGYTLYCEENLSFDPDECFKYFKYQADTQDIRDFIINQYHRLRFPLDQSQSMDLIGLDRFWFLSHEKNICKIVFGYHAHHNEQSYEVIGPVFDRNLFKYYMELAFKSQLEPFKMASIEEKNEHLSLNFYNDLDKEKFVEWLRSPISFSNQLQNSELNLDQRSFYLFLEELSLSRKFWIFLNSYLK